MMKYLIGIGALVAVVVAYFVLVPADSPPAPAPTPEPAVTAPAPEPEPETAPVAPEAIVPSETASAAPDQEALFEEMAADARENLPSRVTDTLSLTDAIFVPRMWIMEYNYVTTAADARASAAEMRTLIESRSETICTDGREMFDMGVTLRNSFEDRDGNLFQRVYLLPEDCQRFY